MNPFLKIVPGRPAPQSGTVQFRGPQTFFTAPHPSRRLHAQPPGELHAAAATMVQACKRACDLGRPPAAASKRESERLLKSRRQGEEAGAASVSGSGSSPMDPGNTSKQRRQGRQQGRQIDPSRIQHQRQLRCKAKVVTRASGERRQQERAERQQERLAGTKKGRRGASGSRGGAGGRRRRRGRRGRRNSKCEQCLCKVAMPGLTPQ